MTTRALGHPMIQPRETLLSETLKMHSNDAHALTWVVYEQLVGKIRDKAEATEANKLRVSQERVQRVAQPDRPGSHRGSA
eukprot:8140926-Pyramimonas_sp.AAC.1